MTSLHNHNHSAISPLLLASIPVFLKWFSFTFYFFSISANTVFLFLIFSLWYSVNEDVLVRLKWGHTEYKGQLVSVDSYMNIQLSNTEEFIEGKSTGSLGQVLIRLAFFFFLFLCSTPHFPWGSFSSSLFVLSRSFCKLEPLQWYLRLWFPGHPPHPEVGGWMAVFFSVLVFIYM